MEHTMEFQNGTYGGVSEWNIQWSFRMEHTMEFQNGAYGGVSEWNIQWSFRMEIKISRVWLSQKKLMCLFGFIRHMATSCFDQAARLQETLKTK